MRSAPGWGLPPAGERLRVYGMAGMVALVFAIVYGGANQLAPRIPWRLEVDLPWEASIPFVPATAPLYLSLQLLMPASLLVLRTWRAVTPLFVALLAETLIALPFFVLLPAELRFPAPTPPAGWQGAFFRLADLLNLDHNLLPSLHVAYAVTVALALWPALPRFAGVLVALWASTIVASTVLLHQHHLADVAAGLLLAAGVWSTLGRRARREGFLRAWDAELLCLENLALFVRRHRRYLTIGVLVWMAGLRGWRRRRVLRTGFCALQAIDDVLDGDRPSDEEPTVVVDRLLAQLEAKPRPVVGLAEDRLARLVAVFADDLEEAAGSAGLADAATLIRTMQVDRVRRRQSLRGELLDDDALQEHLRRTFGLSVDLMLAGGRCELRSAEVPALIDAFAWCSVVRDLREDLASGLINLPRAVAERARAESASPEPIAWLGTKALKSWLEEERTRVVALLDQADARLAALRGRSGAGVLAMFARSIRRYTRRRPADIIAP